MNATCGLTLARQSGAGRFKPEALRSLNERPPGRLGVQAVRAVRAGRQDSARPSPGGPGGPSGPGVAGQPRPAPRPSRPPATLRPSVSAAFTLFEATTLQLSAGDSK